MVEKGPPDFLLKEDLKKFRDNFSDEVPAEIIHGPREVGTDTKARRNWFQMVATTLELLVKVGNIDEEIQILIEQFVDYYTSSEFNRLTQPSDIQKANNVINTVLGEQPVLSLTSAD